MTIFSLSRVRLLASAGFVWLAAIAPALAEDLRIVTWNIDADTGGSVGQMGGVDGGPGLVAVLQAIGQEKLAGNAQPIDVLALEELNGTGTNAANATNATLEYVTTQLNDIYGAGTYAYDTVTDNTTGSGDTGNGPSGLIYNTKTVVDLGASNVGTPSSSGASRDPMLYHLAPVGDSSASFYMYVQHAKSGGGSSDEARREVEAAEVRASAATLPAGSHIIYAGDMNLNDSTEAAYQTMIASGTGQAFDPANPSENWLDTSAYASLMTEDATYLEYRDDFQMVNSATLNGTSGLVLVNGSYENFGNNGSVGFKGSVTDSDNTAINDLSNQKTILTDLSTATDHLPIVADYAVLTPEPASWLLMALAAIPVLCAARRRVMLARSRC